MVTDRDYELAEANGREKLLKEPLAVAVRYDRASHRIAIDLNRGYSILFSPERVQELQHASDEDLSEVEIDFPGSSIYFPRLDAGLLVESALTGRFGNDRWEAEWARKHSVDQAA